MALTHYVICLGNDSNTFCDLPERISILISRTKSTFRIIHYILHTEDVHLISNSSCLKTNISSAFLNLRHISTDDAKILSHPVSTLGNNFLLFLSLVLHIQLDAKYYITHLPSSLQDLRYRFEVKAISAKKENVYLRPGIIQLDTRDNIFFKEVQVRKKHTI